MRVPEISFQAYVGAKKNCLISMRQFFICALYAELLFDDVSVQSCKDVIYIAFSMDVEVDWLGKIQAEDSHD